MLTPSTPRKINNTVINFCCDTSQVQSSKLAIKVSTSILYKTNTIKYQQQQLLLRLQIFPEGDSRSAS